MIEKLTLPAGFEMLNSNQRLGLYSALLCSLSVILFFIEPPACVSISNLTVTPFWNTKPIEPPTE